MDIRLVQKRWERNSTSTPIFIIDLIQEILAGFAEVSKTALFPKDKAYALLILMCSEITATPGELVLVDTSGDNARLAYCKALLSIADSTLQNRDVSRLAESRLIGELGLLSLEHPLIGEGTDLWVSSLKRYLSGAKF